MTPEQYQELIKRLDKIEARLTVIESGKYFPPTPVNPLYQPWALPQIYCGGGQ